jgi:FAD:protein FMN transferase
MRIGVGRASVLLLVCNLHLSALAAQGAPHEFREVHLGMELRLVLHAPEARARAAAEAAFTEVARLEAILTDWRPDSELRRVTAGPPGEWRGISQPLGAVLARALAMAAWTDGAFDPTIGPLTSRWRAVRDGAYPPSADDLAALRTVVGWQLVSLDVGAQRVQFARAGMQLDLGAIAKGWILDRTRERLAAFGVTRALVEAGGDIVVGDPPPGAEGWHISIARPRDDTVVVLANQAIASSGDAFQVLERDGVRQSHVIDPRRGFGLTTRRSATVIAGDGATADALATALTLVPPARGHALAAQLGAKVMRLDP